MAPTPSSSLQVTPRWYVWSQVTLEQSLKHLCANNNLALNTQKTKDFRWARSHAHTPIYINGAAAERVSSFKFPSIHLLSNFTWSLNPSILVKKVQQHCYFLGSLKEAQLYPSILMYFYRCIIESILTNRISAGGENCPTHHRQPVPHYWEHLSQALPGQGERHHLFLILTMDVPPFSHPAGRHYSRQPPLPHQQPQEELGPWGGDSAELHTTALGIITLTHCPSTLISALLIQAQTKPFTSQINIIYIVLTSNCSFLVYTVHANLYTSLSISVHFTSMYITYLIYYTYIIIGCSSLSITLYIL